MPDNSLFPSNRKMAQDGPKNINVGPATMQLSIKLYLKY